MIEGCPEAKWSKYRLIEGSPEASYSKYYTILATNLPNKIFGVQFISGY